VKLGWLRQPPQIDTKIAYRSITQIALNLLWSIMLVKSEDIAWCAEMISSCAPARSNSSYLLPCIHHMLNAFALRDIDKNELNHIGKALGYLHSLLQAYKLTFFHYAKRNKEALKVAATMTCYEQLLDGTKNIHKFIESIESPKLPFLLEELAQKMSAHVCSLIIFFKKLMDLSYFRRNKSKILSSLSLLKKGKNTSK